MPTAVHLTAKRAAHDLGEDGHEQTIGILCVWDQHHEAQTREQGGSS